MDNKTVFVNMDKQDKETLKNDRYNGEIRREDSVKAVYAELGKVYYENMFECPLPQLLPFFDKITLMKRLIEYKDNEQKKSKGLLECLNQEVLNEYEELGKAYYEGNFEKPLPQVQVFFDKIEELKKEKQTRRKLFCINCGKEVKEDGKFCPYCGVEIVRKVNK